MSADELLRQALDHHHAGRLAEASRLYQEILEATPDDIDVLYLLATLAYQAGQPSHTVELSRRALAVAPEQARLHHLMGLGERALGNAENAEAAFRQAIALEADHARALAVLGQMLKSSARVEEAAALLQRAAVLLPEDADLDCDLGDTLQTLGRFDDAAAAYQRGLARNPTLPRAWYAAGCLESSRKDYAAAIGYFTKALELHPDWPQAQHNLGQVLFKLGQVEDALQLFRQAAGGDDAALPLSAIALIIPGSPASDNAAILNTRRSWAERHLPAPKVPGRVKTGEPLLRVGYVSSFFQDHNWMKPVWGLINHHDRRRFEIHLFSDAAASKIRYGYRANAQDHFHDASGLSNDALAECIERAGIDLLIDLNGYSAMERLPLFQMRPAPVVAAWFNMYATSGIPGYDYLIGDDVVIPPEEEAFYCEKIVRVAGSYLTFEVDYPVPDVTDPPCMRNGAITFGCLASQYKITPQVIEAWSCILRQVPGSSLRLKNGALVTPGTRQLFSALFEAYGIAPERIRLEGPADHYRFLEAYGTIDIALDAFPYNGGTTTTEAIWQGVPVVTFTGDRWVSRTSASILKAAGLSELIGAGVDEYVSLAIGLANSPERLRELRRTMRPRLAASPVCDTEAFARNMERLYSGMVAGIVR